MKKWLAIILVIFGSIQVYSQNCNCLENFDFLVKKLSSDYAGFNDKVNEKTMEEYNHFTEVYRERAASINSIKRCELILEEWLGFFNDKHLRLETTVNIYWTFEKIDSNTILFRIPSFSWDSKPIIDSLVRTNFELLTSTPILILDLRGNGGGIDYSFLELLPLLYTNPYIDEGPAWWSSEGNISFFEDALENGNIRQGQEKSTKELIAKLKENPNAFVTVDKADTVRQDTVFEYPQKVGVIVNDFCASSCEEFVLYAKESKKVTVFGTNTLGVLDYSNTVPVDMPTENMQIRYPMTRSNRLPDYPIDNIGIEPDVRITLLDNLNLKSDVDDWVRFVQDYFKAEMSSE